MGKHTPATEQRRLVDLWHQSDLSMAGFARSHGIQPVTFGTWVCRQREVPVAPEPVRFLQVAVAAAERAPAEALAVRVGPHVLQFDALPPPGWFAAVLRELVPC